MLIVDWLVSVLVIIWVLVVRLVLVCWIDWELVDWVVYCDGVLVCLEVIGVGEVY